MCLPPPAHTRSHFPRSALTVTLTLFVRTLNAKLPVNIAVPTAEEADALLKEFDADKNSHLDFGAWLIARA